jgi:hypothetical protein
MRAPSSSSSPTWGARTSRRARTTAPSPAVPSARIARARRRDARRDGVHRANRRTRAVEKFVDS